MDLLKFLRGLGIASDELALGFEPDGLLEILGESEVEEDPFSERGTPAHIRWLDVPVNDAEGVHFFHPFKQVPLKVLVLRLFHIIAEFHGELDAIVVADDVVAEHLLEIGAKFEDRGDLVEDQLSQHFVNFEIEGGPVLRLYFL